ELAFAFAFEEIQLAREAAAEDVADAVAIEIHKLWREADASARRQADNLAACLKPLELIEFGLVPRADVGVNPKLALAELSYKQDHLAIALHVGHKWSGVPHVYVDRLTCGLQQDRRRKVGRRIGRGQQAGQDAAPHRSFLRPNRCSP